jgi:hypothetical protein
MKKSAAAGTGILKEVEKEGGCLSAFCQVQLKIETFNIFLLFQAQYKIHTRWESVSFKHVRVAQSDAIAAKIIWACVM